MDKLLFINKLYLNLSTNLPEHRDFGAKKPIHGLFERQTSAEQRQRSNRSRPLLCNGTGPFFLTSAAGRQRLGAKKQRSARVLARVLKDFL
jgi:hypothetical protein